MHCDRGRVEIHDYQYPSPGRVDSEVRYLIHFFAKTGQTPGLGTASHGFKSWPVQRPTRQEGVRGSCSVIVVQILTIHFKLSQE